MLLTCEQCATAYRLDPAMLGVGGRMVRCTNCQHIWFQPPGESEAGAPGSAPAPQAGEAAAHPEIALEEHMEEAAENDAEAMPFREMLAENAKINAEKPLPQAVAPLRKGPETEAETYQPMGMSAEQFGVLTCLLLCFVTLIPLFLAKDVIAQNLPAMSRLYTSIGMEVRAPGEGLSLSGLTAERRNTDGREVLAVEAKLANISKASLPYPSILVTVKGPYGAKLKEWDFHPEPAKLASGESVPIKMEFKDAPEEAKMIELRVFEP